MILGDELFAEALLGGGFIDGSPVPWFEICESETTWTNIPVTDLAIVRCEDAT